MLKKSNSKTSFQSLDNKSNKINKIQPFEHAQQIQNSLQYASKLLSHQQFTAMYERMMKNLIRKAEVQSPNSQTVYLQTVKNCLLIYGGSLQLNVRALLLEILSGLNSRMLEQIPSKINKAKHIVLQTHIQYLLSKIFLLEMKYHHILNDETNASKSLRKCLDLNQEHMVQFMQQSQQIRKEIVDYAIVAYYQTFKLKKTHKPSQALENLLKACNIAKKNYGQYHKISKGLIELYNNQQNLLNSLEKMSMKSRAITDILDYENKKNYKTTAFYSWQDEKIVVQLLKLKGKERQIISESSYDIKLDMNKIKLLQSSNNQWLSTLKDGEIVINQDQLMRVLGLNSNESNQKQQTTAIELKNISKEQIIRKTYPDSSQDDQQLWLSKINIFKHPRAQSSRKFKDTQ